MKSGAKNKILIILFCGFVGIGAALFFALPKSDFSVNEKRALAAAPELLLKSIFDGSFESGVEEYLNDHFPAREALVAIDAYSALYTGRNGKNGVYKGKNGYLINVPVTPDEKKISANIEAVNAFAAKTGIPASMMIVPTAGYVLPDMLPAIHEDYKDGEIISDIYSRLNGVKTVDLVSFFARFGADLYYKTDHHWTTEGAYEAYLAWAEESGITPIPRDMFTVETHGGFYGTTYSKSALWCEKSDDIELWKYPSDVTVQILDEGDEKTSDSLYFEGHLSEPDKYPVFLDGNHAFERITNADAPEKRLLLIKDSYAHCLAPFLANHYSEIDMIDMRYYLSSVSELAAERNYDEVLFVYGLSSVCEDGDLAILE